MSNENTPLSGQPFSIGLVHDAGAVRANNEDSSWIPPQDWNADLLTERGWLFIVADGMGGYQAGEVASRLTATAASQSYYGAHESADIMEWLRQAAQDAQQAIITHQREVLAGAQIGSTLVMAVIRGADLYLVNVGDSRCYRLRDGVLTQLSRDHSWVADQVRAGLLTPEEASNNPHRNILTRGLGQTDKYARPDIEKFDWDAGDRLLLCSDGLWDAVPFDQLGALIALPDPQAAADAMLRAALDASASDNVTALIVAAASAPVLSAAPVTAPITESSPVITTDELAAPAKVTNPLIEAAASASQQPAVVLHPPTQRPASGAHVTTPILLMAGAGLILVLIAAVILISQLLRQPRSAEYARPTLAEVATAVVAAGGDKPTPAPAQVLTVTPLGTKPAVQATQTFSEVQAANTPVAAEPTPTVQVATVTAMPTIGSGQCVTRAMTADDWQWKSNIVKLESGTVAIRTLAAPIETKATLSELLGIPELRAPFSIRVMARGKQWVSNSQIWSCFPQDSKTSVPDCQDLQKVSTKNVALDTQTSTRTYVFSYNETPVNQHLRLITTSNLYVYLMEISYCAQ